MGAITRAAANNITTGGVILPAGITDASVASITEVQQVPAEGGLNLLSTATASASASIEFTSGIDSTYDVYYFEFNSIHPATDGMKLQFNLSTDGGSTYAVTKTSTFFLTLHYETLGSPSLNYNTGNDLAQSTANQTVINGIGNGNDESGSGTLYLFNPSSSVYVKHFISNSNFYGTTVYSANNYMAGYANTTSPINAVKFVGNTGNIDAGTIKMYGVTSS